MVDSDYRYEPDTAVAPGEILGELLQARQMTQRELAERLGMTTKAISQLMTGKMGLSQDTALKLERVVGVDASFWNNLESHYKEWQARKAEAERLEEQRSFLKSFPYKEMVKRGWLQDASTVAEKLRELLNFFQVADPDAWQQHWGNARLAAFRKTNAKNVSEYATAAWLRAGEVAAEQIEISAYNSRKFRNALDVIRELIPDPPADFSAQMMMLCAQAGVALVLMPQMPKTGISGATRWVHKKPIIQLTLRHKSEDLFWFAFFHEAAHILLHGRTEAFWKGIEPEDEAWRQKEDEADQFAGDLLIPPELWTEFIACNDNFYPETITEFARRAGTAPGVVVGRLQKEGLLRYEFNNHLKRRFDWINER